MHLQVRISLNGVQFSHEAYQMLGFWGLEPMDKISVIAPSAGPLHGGLISKLTGLPGEDDAKIMIKFDPGIAAVPVPSENFDELFVEGAAFPNRADLFALLPRCKFGDAVIDAEQDGDSTFSCHAPSGAEAGSELVASPRTRDELCINIEIDPEWFTGHYQTTTDVGTTTQVAPEFM